jgi:hypothetical protein
VAGRQFVGVSEFGVRGCRALGEWLAVSAERGGGLGTMDGHGWTGWTGWTGWGAGGWDGTRWRTVVCEV